MDEIIVNKFKGFKHKDWNDGGMMMCMMGCNANLPITMIHGEWYGPYGIQDG